jgi:hypothetical protein
MTRKLAHWMAAMAISMALGVGGAGTALAKHGADDPPGHHQEHHGKKHHKHKHHHHHGEDHHNGGDDGPGHT